jgi:hypothetical protein
MHDCRSVIKDEGMQALAKLIKMADAAKSYPKHIQKGKKGKRFFGLK